MPNTIKGIKALFQKYEEYVEELKLPAALRFNKYRCRAGEAHHPMDRSLQTGATGPQPPKETWLVVCPAHYSGLLLGLLQVTGKFITEV